MEILEYTPSVPTKLSQNFWAQRLRNCVEKYEREIKLERQRESKVDDEIK